MLLSYISTTQLKVDGVITIEVLMTSDVDGNYRGVYTYDNQHELIGVEDLGNIEGK